MNSIPWYRAAVLRGILIAVISQVIARVQARYHIDFAVLGVNANTIVDWLMDMIAAGALAYASHGRITKPLPPVTLTKEPQ